MAALKRAIKKILRDRGLAENALLKNSPNTAYKVYVCIYP